MSYQGPEAETMLSDLSDKAVCFLQSSALFPIFRCSDAPAALPTPLTGQCLPVGIVSRTEHTDGEYRDPPRAQSCCPTKHHIMQYVQPTVQCLPRWQHCDDVTTCFTRKRLCIHFSSHNQRLSLGIQSWAKPTLGGISRLLYATFARDCWLTVAGG